MPLTAFPLPAKPLRITFYRLCWLNCCCSLITSLFSHDFISYSVYVVRKVDAKRMSRPKEKGLIW